MNEPLAGRRLVSFTMSPNRFAELRKHCTESPEHTAWFDGVALYVADDLADDRYLETYHDGTIRMVIEEGPTINLDAVQEIRTYAGIHKPRRNHQRPLRNIRRQSK
jgi:hypothetical protein